MTVDGQRRVEMTPRNPLSQHLKGRGDLFNSRETITERRFVIALTNQFGKELQSGGCVERFSNHPLDEVSLSSKSVSLNDFV